MGRREELIAEGAKMDRDHGRGTSANVSRLETLAERQALALEGIEDLLRELIPPAAPTSHPFMVDANYDVIGGGKIGPHCFRVMSGSAASTAEKLADLLNRHWGE